MAAAEGRWSNGPTRKFYDSSAFPLGLGLSFRACLVAAQAAWVACLVAAQVA